MLINVASLWFVFDVIGKVALPKLCTM